MVPERQITGVSLLKSDRCSAGRVGEVVVETGPLRRLGVDALQIFQCHRGFRRVVGGRGFEEREVGLALFDGGDEEAHLEPPVPEMRVANDLVAGEGEEPGE